VRGFTDTWLLIIDTVATINASLMVFIIQNTQNRENKALHIKVDGIIAAIKDTEKQLIAIEEEEEEELEKIRKHLIQKIK
jgi:low affinity Fe/Cu permease